MATTMDASWAQERVRDLVANVERVVHGCTAVVRNAVICLLAEGHLLIEGVPGVAKTTLAKAIAHSIGAQVNRIQFTPDLLPSDVVGVNIFDTASRASRFIRARSSRTSCSPTRSTGRRRRHSPRCWRRWANAR